MQRILPQIQNDKTNVHVQHAECPHYGEQLIAWIHFETIIITKKKTVVNLQLKKNYCRCFLPKNAILHVVKNNLKST